MKWSFFYFSDFFNSDLPVDSSNKSFLFCFPLGIIYVVSPGRFRKEAEEIFAWMCGAKYMLTKTRSLARVARSSSLRDEIPIFVRSTVSETSIQDGEGDWSSQNWVGDAFARLVGTGVDETVDVVLEAGDEEIQEDALSKPHWRVFSLAGVVSSESSEGNPSNHS